LLLADSLNRELKLKKDETDVIIKVALRSYARPLLYKLCYMVVLFDRMTKLVLHHYKEINSNY